MKDILPAVERAAVRPAYFEPAGAKSADSKFAARKFVPLTLLSAVLLSGCVAAPAEAPAPPPLPGKVVHYTCTGKSHVAVTYGQGTATLAGPETLLADDTGQRYTWPSDGTHHVWALAGGIGTLSLSDGAKGTEKVVQSGCKADGVAQ